MQARGKAVRRMHAKVRVAVATAWINLNLQNARTGFGDKIIEPGTRSPRLPKLGSLGIVKMNS